MKYRIDIDYYKYGEGYSHTETIENTDTIPFPNLSEWEWEWDDKYYYTVRCVDNETETTLWERQHEVEKEGIND